MIDAELVTRTALTADFAEQRVCTETPSGVGFAAAITAGGIIRVVGGPGANNRTLERALVDVDCFAADRDLARALAERVRDWFMALSHTIRGGVAFTLVETTMRPHWLPWDNTDVRRFGATYQLYLA